MPTFVRTEKCDVDVKVKTVQLACTSAHTI